MTSTLENPTVFGVLETFDRTITATGALISLVSERMWHEGLKDDANGVSELFNMQMDRLEECRDFFQEDARQREAAAADEEKAATDRRQARLDALRLIQRTVDTSLIAERYALPQETIRDILYAMMDAPVKVPTFQDLPIAEPKSDTGMTPVDPIDISALFDPEVEARKARIDRTVDKMTKPRKPGGDRRGRTGTDE